MLKLSDWRLFFAAVGLVGILLLASPTLALVLKLPKGETFSELWILGPEHMAEGYPYTVKSNETYTIYVGVGNHLGSSAYYAVYVKFRNQSDPLPNATISLPSSLPVLYEYRVFLTESESWESKLEFSFGPVFSFENRCLVEDVIVNGVNSRVAKMASWDFNGTGYYYQLFFELWIHDAEDQALKFHNRYVGLWLNMTG